MGAGELTFLVVQLDCSYPSIVDPKLGQYLEHPHGMLTSETFQPVFVEPIERAGFLIGASTDIARNLKVKKKNTH